jgi:hypothetical protein
LHVIAALAGLVPQFHVVGSDSCFVVWGAVRARCFGDRVSSAVGGQLVPLTSGTGEYAARALERFLGGESVHAGLNRVQLS